MADDFHDWHSLHYVDDWIHRIEKRSPRLVRRRIERYRNTLREFSFSSRQPLRILDLGVGWGDLTKEIFDISPQAEIVALDYSPVMLKKAQDNLSPWGDSVSFHQSDLTEPDALEGLGMFDGILSVSTLHHLKASQINSLFGQIADQLKPHGRFVNCDLYYRSKHLQSRILWRLAEVTRRSNVSSAVAAFLEKTALIHQMQEPQPAWTHRKPLLSEHLDLLNQNGMKGHWRLDNHRFLVVADLDEPNA